MRGYAFEKGGTNNPDYPALSISLLQKIGKDERNADNNLAADIWKEWKDLQPKNISRISFNTEKLGRKSIIELVEEIWKDGEGRTLPLYLSNKIKDSEQIPKAHKELKEVVGIGDKVASFYMRDITRTCEITIDVQENRDLLQPQDIWVNRITSKLFSGEMGDTSQKHEIGKRIVKECGTKINPELVNMGMWYFGAKIVRSKYELNKVLGYDYPEIKRYCTRKNWGVWQTEFYHLNDNSDFVKK